MKKILFGDITKSEECGDDTLKVWGWASSDNVDSDGEIITSEAMKNAIVDYMKFGAVREMHGSVAAGTAIEIDVKEDGKTWFGAHIVDPVAVKKVRAGVYKGFSIGARVKARDTLNKSIITALNLFEISLVDRPANPDAVFEMFKADQNYEDEIMDENVEVVKADEVIVEPIVMEEKCEEIEKKEEIEEIKADENIEIVKSLGNVAWLSRILEDLKYLEDCVENEAEWKNGDLEIVKQLEAAMKNLSGILLQMTTKEVNEIIEVEDKEQTLRDVQELTTDFKSVNMNDNDLNKVDDIKKNLDEAINKAAQLTQENEALQKRVKELEAEPAEPKAVLKVIGKGSDGGDLGDVQTLEVEPVYKLGTKEVDDIATMIKKAQQNGKVLKY